MPCQSRRRTRTTRRIRAVLSLGAYSLITSWDHSRRTLGIEGVAITTLIGSLEFQQRV